MWPVGARVSAGLLSYVSASLLVLHASIIYMNSDLLVLHHLSYVSAGALILHN